MPPLSVPESASICIAQISQRTDAVMLSFVFPGVGALHTSTKRLLKIWHNIPKERSSVHISIWRFPEMGVRVPLNHPF